MKLAVKLMITSAAALVFLWQPGASVAAGRNTSPMILQQNTQPVAGSLSTGSFQIMAQNSSQAGDKGKYIPPSVALKNAMRYVPGSKGLGVKLRQGARPVYAVKLKSGNRVHRIMIDARTGKRVGG